MPMIKSISIANIMPPEIDAKLLCKHFYCVSCEHLRNLIQEVLNLLAYWLSLSLSVIKWSKSLEPLERTTETIQGTNNIECEWQTQPQSWV